MSADIQNTNKFKIIDSFNKKTISDKRYLRHCDLDLTINLKITGILNYQNLLNEEDCSFISSHFNKNYKYLADLEKEKNEIVERYGVGSTKMTNSKEKLLNFTPPEFEIYFVARFYVNRLCIEPEVTTDVVLSSQMNENISFRYKYKDLTSDACVTISVYSMQLPMERQLLASTMINLFDLDSFNLIQGKHVFTLHSHLEPDHRPKSKTNGKIQPSNQEIDILVNRFYQENSNITYEESYKRNYQEKLTNLLTKTENAFIECVFPSFNNSVVYEEEKTQKSYYKSLKIKGANNTFLTFDNWVGDCHMLKGQNFLSHDNPITEKFSALSRISEDYFARDIRPSPHESGRIDELLNTPDFIKLEDNDIILFWKYRYFLMQNNRKYSLTKILNAVKWGDAKSETEFIKNILHNWKDIEVCDILYMLSFKFCVNPIYSKERSMKYNELRQFAVKHLDKLDDGEINFILLQLVQALRYEDEETVLRKFLITRCSKSSELATSLYWFLKVEADDTVLIKSQRGIKMVQTYKVILEEFYSSLRDGVLDGINSQVSLRDHLIGVSSELSKVSKAENKKNRLKQVIKPGGSVDMSKFTEPLQLPLHPNIKINGTLVDQCRVFTSAKYPVKYSFTVTNDSQQFNDKEDPSIYEIMFKFGDDLRQDQLILQIFNYMDNLLKKVHLDFEFTTYKVLATSKSDGFVEFVPNSTTIYDILKKYDDQIRPFLVSERDMQKQLDSFINSCAGYCVVTYILGIGDRHLENLLIDKKGKLFHIDFGYILGNDPKIYPPPMKLCKQMVECMGGKNSKGYEDFKKKCVDAYLYLRNNARLIVNMFYLMIHCGINELNENAESVLNKLHEKFVPNLNPQEASNSLLSKLEESVSAFYPYLMEKFHSWANYWK